MGRSFEECKFRNHQLLRNSSCGIMKICIRCHDDVVSHFTYSFKLKPHAAAWGKISRIDPLGTMTSCPKFVVEVFQSGFSGDKTVLESANKHVQPSCTLWHSCCFSASLFYFTPTQYSQSFIVCHWDTLLEQFRVYRLLKEWGERFLHSCPYFTSQSRDYALKIHTVQWNSLDLDPLS